MLENERKLRQWFWTAHTTYFFWSRNDTKQITSSARYVDYLNFLHWQIKVFLATLKNYSSSGQKLILGQTFCSELLVLLKEEPVVKVLIKHDPRCWNLEQRQTVWLKLKTRTNHFVKVADVDAKPSPLGLLPGLHFHQVVSQVHLEKSKNCTGAQLHRCI